MKFVSIKIVGFKSFLDKTEIDLKNGLTGIVGPNGCGKSNIIEAMKWVMGENSAKQMRSGEMSNVIFSGTEERPSRNFAEVSIKVDNSEKKAPHPFTNIQELEISRKIEKDKGSIYKINGKIVRARDIQLIFADTGTGARSSSIVSQGKISEIIESKPEMRRIILEEAANITGLHSRKHEAELKLNSANENLDRLLDLENTLNEQLKELNKQSRQVARYRSVGDRLRKAEACLFYAQLKILENKKSVFNETLKLKTNEVSEIQIKIANLENKKLKIQNEIPNLKNIDNSKLNDLQNFKIAKIKLEQEINSINDSKNSLQNQIEQLNEEINRENDIINDAEKTVLNLNKEIEKLKKEGFNYFAKLERASEKTSNLRKDVEKINSSLSKINSEILLISKNKDEVENEINDINTRVLKIKNQLKSFETEKDLKTVRNGIKNIEKIKNHIDTQRKLENESKTKIKSSDIELKKLNVQKIEINTKINNINTEISTIKTFLTDQEENSLEKNIALLQNLESPIASVLGEALSAPILKNNDSDKDHFWIEKFENKSNLVKLPSNIKPITDKIKNSKILLYSLQGVGLVKSEKDAYELQKKLLFGQSLTTLKGGLWRWDGYVQKPGAKNSYAKRLILRKELNNLQKELTKNIGSLKKINEKLKIDELSIHKLTLENESQKKQISDLENNLNNINLEVSLSESRIESSKILIEEIKNAELQSNNKLMVLKEQVDDLKKLPSLQAEEIKIRNHFENTKKEFEDALAYEKSLNSQEDFRKKNLDQSLSQITNWEDRKKSGKTRLENLKNKLLELNKELKNMFNLPGEFTEKADKLESKLEKSITDQKKSSDNLIIKENELREVEKKQKLEEELFINFREEKVRIESDINSIDININNLQERLNEKLKISFDDLLKSTGETEDFFSSIEDQTLNSIELKVERLIKERENIGAVNLRVEIEIEELKEKINKMVIERDDLSQAIAKLKSGIHELNKESRERLQNSFDEVNKNFQFLFKKLFQGGTAELKLIGSDDVLTSGLEIYASPPGKKMQSLSLFSGGEQALLSISLIFSVFLSNPSPICILDEVDAALDDTNVSRFCDLLEELVNEKNISFIIVTHHRLTMAKMNRLLGVTMQEKGISKLLTVDLEKAVEIREAS